MLPYSLGIDFERSAKKSSEYSLSTIELGQVSPFESLTGFSVTPAFSSPAAASELLQQESRNLATYGSALWKAKDFYRITQTVCIEV